jgi:hypothetical protein
MYMWTARRKMNRRGRSLQRPPRNSINSLIMLRREGIHRNRVRRTRRRGGRWREKTRNINDRMCYTLIS